MAVQHELPRLRTRGRQARAPHHVIEAAFEHDDQVFAGVALSAHGLLKVVAELPLQQAVRSFHLLFLAQLQAVTRDLGAPRLPVLPRHEIALLNGAFLRKATQALQKQLLPFPAAEPANRFAMSCQRYFSFTRTTFRFQKDSLSGRSKIAIAAPCLPRANSTHPDRQCGTRRASRRTENSAHRASSLARSNSRDMRPRLRHTSKIERPALPDSWADRTEPASARRRRNTDGPTASAVPLGSRSA